MELCTGGSLYDVIDSPENAYGLCEAEFKQVIYDVGMYMYVHCTYSNSMVVDNTYTCSLLVSACLVKWNGTVYVYTYAFANQNELAV